MIEYFSIYDKEPINEIPMLFYCCRKYAEETSAAARFGQGGEDMGDEITQQSLLPGVKVRSQTFGLFLKVFFITIL